MYFINVILRYGFESSILSVNELSLHLFVWLTFVAPSLHLWITLTFRLLLWWKNFSPANQRRLSLLTHSLIFIVMPRIRLGQPASVAGLGDHSPILRFTDRPYIACLPTSVAIALIELRRLYHLITRNDSFQQPQQELSWPW
ncbi:TRAP transporter small permease subunit [Salmonella enterica subsp. enterica]|nr:TRAP transporter small permease subunit [Salmonella enterica subsp. enterica]